MSVDRPFRVVYTKGAEADLDGIAESESLSLGYVQGLKTLNRIIAAVETLAPFPVRSLYHLQPAAGPPIHFLPVLPYVIFYRIEETAQVVRVVRIRHAARRPLKRFS